MGADIVVQDLRLIDYVFQDARDNVFLIFEYRKYLAEDDDYSVDDEEVEEYKFILVANVAGMLASHYREFWHRYAGGEFDG